MTNLSGMGYGPFIYDNAENSDANLKQPHDRYQVYVNGDLVGDKVLLTQSEKIDDVSSYLKRNGFRNFDSKLDGDHFNIDVTDDDKASEMKQQLNVWLSIR